MPQDPLVPSRAYAPPRPDQAAALQALIQSHSGLRVDAAKLEHSLYRAWGALQAEGVADFDDLAAQLRMGRLWRMLLPFLTINETYFLREPRQLEDFVEVVLPGLRQRATARGAQTLKILSAACSTGEEVYTLAMLLAGAGAKARVHGIDIDPDVVAKAEQGIYGPNSFRGVDPAWRARHFQELDGNRWQVLPAFREDTQFQLANLLEVERALAGQRFDAIFCRNVLIYFDRPTQLAVVGQLRRLLVPGGFLFLGHSEMFFDVDLGLTVTSTQRSTLYQLAEAPAWP